nr:uncharacterized protein LOC128684232 [Cherax quadricarinatus]XP_053626380.1 uncharacterized protein LOC128684232 [Cherax quadricarinatus]
MPLQSSVLLEAFEGAVFSVPLCKIYVLSKYYIGYLTVGVSEGFPMEDAVLLLGNNIFNSTKCPEPIVTNTSPKSAITRAKSHEMPVDNAAPFLDDSDHGLDNLFYEENWPEPRKFSEKSQIKSSYSRVAGFPYISVSMPEGMSFREEQRRDPSLNFAFQAAMSESHSDHPVKYEIKYNLLLCTETGKEVGGSTKLDRLVVPKKFRSQILNIADNSSLGGHLGITKTFYRIFKEFYWRKIRQDVKNHICSCKEYQQVGKPGHPHQTCSSSSHTSRWRTVCRADH